VRVPTGRTARTLPRRAVLEGAALEAAVLETAGAGWPDDAAGEPKLAFAIGS
jgi:hypothetical protein